MNHTSHGDYPDVVGQYAVEGVLGEGGMGVVVAARHKTLGHAVAIKFLTQKVAHDQVAVARFLREAKATLGIQNEHVVRIMDMGTLDNGAPYMVMERLVGRNLHSLLAERHTLGVSEAVDYVLQACEAIAEAHAIGIVHRDLKPENLFLTQRRDGSPFVKVLDFGISKWTEGDQNFSLTATASVMGSPFYMSPEQVRSTKSVDLRADVWALGVVLHELLSGETPFRGETLGAIHAAIVSDPPAALRERRPDVPPALEAVIVRCLEKKASHRYANIAMLARALLPFAERSKDSVERILRDSHSTTPVEEFAVDEALGAPTVNERTRARSATVEGWGTDALRDRGKRRLAQVAVGLGAMALLGGGSLVLLQRAQGPSAPSSDGTRVAGSMPVAAAAASATEPRTSPTPAENPPEPAASAPELAPAVPASAEVRRRPAARPPRPAPASSSSKAVTPPSSPRRTKMRMLRSVRVPMVCLALFAPLLAGRARAQATKSDAAQAESLFVEAKKLMEAGRYSQACPLLVESQRLDPGGGTLLNLAACHEKEGRIATAWAEFNAAVAIANKDARADRVTFAQERIAALEPLLPRLTISAPASAAASGYEIVLDDVKRGSVTWGHASPMDPGHHLVRATAPGKRAWERAFDVQERQTLVVEVPVLEEATSHAAAPSSPDAKASAPSSGSRTWAFVAGGAGIAAVAVGSYLGLEAKKLQSESDEQCPTPTGECTQWAVDKNDSARRTANVATAAFAVGIVGLGVGTYLLLVPSRTSASPAPSASRGVSAWVTADSTGVTLRGRF